MDIFSIHHTDSSCAARTGTLTLAHGGVQTPVFMPVGTNATVKAMANESLLEIGFDIILSNTYHLFLRPGTDVIKKHEGLHRFCNWRRNILTDSGGFQIFSLARLRKISEEGARFRSHIDGSEFLLTPEKAAEIQCILNSDIQMQLDVCTPPDIPETEALDALLLTGRWLRRAQETVQKARDSGYAGEIFSIVQGNFYRELRKRSAALCAEAGTSGIAIGGLSVGESPEKFCDFLGFTASLLPKEKPRYVMGIGTPQYILEAIENGVDMFDCVLPTRSARNGLALTHSGPLSIKKENYKEDERALDGLCSCPVCANYSRAYLRHLFKSGEILVCMLLSYHNLFFLNELVVKARDAINADRFRAFKSEFLALYGSGVD
ncbi:MAG: tRNA guanosine(34) transglycosylase Tgt [Spirochaetaceae bacterium]|jgi:queuine tRNA-ribosyltransferase|nr:tRNA guanosine(34) transglycosylase Tgt [Spirochaetaceae bacterium]